MPFTIIFLLILLASMTMITGYRDRDYDVLEPKTDISINGRSLTVAAIAKKYQPKLFLHENDFSPPLKSIAYEVIEKKNNIDIVYYPVWENEIFPNPVIRPFYDLQRLVLYGLPFYDIEFIQISIEGTSGNIIGVLFETSDVTQYSSWFTRHKQVRLTTKQLAEISNQRLMLGMKTWNHLYEFITDSDYYNEEAVATLKPLSAKDYRQWKMARRSHGDHH